MTQSLHGWYAYWALASSNANGQFSRSGGIMGSVAIDPPNARSLAIADTTLVICQKAHVHGVCLGVRTSEPCTASFKGFYCRNPAQRHQWFIAFKGKGSIKGFIIIVTTSRAMTQSLHSWYANWVLVAGRINGRFSRSGDIMGSTTIKPLNVSIHVTGDTTLVICRQAHVHGVCLGVRTSEPCTASFKGFYCKNPDSSTSKIYSVQRKRLNQGIYHNREDIQIHNPESSQLICQLSLGIRPRKRPIF
jgi:hypothetical protein